MNRFTNYIFYTLKPVIPRSLQIFLRRRVAQYKRKRYAHIWPIDPNAGSPPAGWDGWPGGRQFAIVLSHDVDTCQGYDNVLKLAEIEEALGFRSCFNFVPERYGKIRLERLDELRRRGFEIAVHGLKHDGKLFFSKRAFDRQAQRINEYLKQWNAKGFTSPSMHHNLKWLAGLDISYSISTFDTDPFEPQPDGVGTIFPLLVRNSDTGQSFAEIPYTLPQDSTLFIILQEKSIDIWKQKLDWIAAKGGTALLNSHPDYMWFDQGDSAKHRYPFYYYTEFLEYLKCRYAGKFLNMLPSELAVFWQRRNWPLSDPTDVALPNPETKFFSKRTASHNAEAIQAR